LSRRIEDLTPRLQILFEKFASKMAEAGLPFVITQTLRSPAEQKAFYAQGREALNETNRLRNLAGLPPITSAENKRRITWTLKSRHLPQADGKSRAFDICITKEGKAQWSDKADVNSNQVPDYKEAGHIGEMVGLLWGGSWRTPDFPHFELKAG